MNEEKTEQKSGLSKRIESTGWALFLVMIGVLFLVPEGTLPESTWLIGAGVILLGVNVARRIFGIKMEAFTVVLGIVALIYGVSNFEGIDVPVFPILLILFGGNIILKQILKKQ